VDLIITSQVCTGLMLYRLVLGRYSVLASAMLLGILKISLFFSVSPVNAEIVPRNRSQQPSYKFLPIKHP
jgi:hypothetical protein